MLTDELNVALSLIEQRVANLTSALRKTETEDPAKARWLVAPNMSNALVRMVEAEEQQA